MAVGVIVAAVLIVVARAIAWTAEVMMAAVLAIVAAPAVPHSQRNSAMTTPTSAALEAVCGQVSRSSANEGSSWSGCCRVCR
jgi:hypothetical protein